ncbi:MAG: acyltransferase [Candidatus Micrarchaeota archaeon]|nr:acyltransferase [Candidatus Micrarchaeota archaeon]
MYRGTEIRLKRTSMIYNNGKLMIGYKDADPSFHTDEKNSLNMDENSKFFVDGYFRFFSGCRIAIRDGAVLRIKDGFMSYNSRIDCSKSIEMGDDVIISENVVIMDSDRHDILREGYERSKPIKIGDHVWIGIRAMILKGVTIGNGSIVAAGAIVTRDVPENCLVAGIPAKVIKRNIRWKK